MFEWLGSFNRAYELVAGGVNPDSDSVNKYVERAEGLSYEIIGQLLFGIHIGVSGNL